jgi:hypothetical protein
MCDPQNIGITQPALEPDMAHARETGDAERMEHATEQLGLSLPVSNRNADIFAAAG